MAGPHTLAETENLVQSRLSDMQLDFQAMAVTSNLFRAANAVRNHLERTVLAPADLTWTAFVVLWVAWIWQTAETRMIAEESGVSKATLSGVLSTLEGRGLVTRRRGETGYWTAPWARGRGVATEALSLLSVWALENLGLRRLDLYAEPENEASHGVALRAGFERGELVRSGIALRGRRYDVIRFTLSG